MSVLDFGTSYFPRTPFTVPQVPLPKPTDMHEEEESPLGSDEPHVPLHKELKHNQSKSKVNPKEESVEHTNKKQPQPTQFKEGRLGRLMHAVEDDFFTPKVYHLDIFGMKIAPVWVALAGGAVLYASNQI